MSARQPTVLVTGASRGLGRSVSVKFARAGARVIGTGRDHDQLSHTARLCGDGAGAFYARHLELRDERAVVQLFREFPDVDICINNAGVAEGRPFLSTSVEDLNRVLEVNVVAAFVVMRESAAAMVARGHGRIVNIASEAAYKGIAGMAAYVASKHALTGLARSLAAELDGSGVQVTTVFPGPIRTEILGPPGWGMEADQVAELVVSVALSGDSVVVGELHLQPRPGL